MSDEIKRQHLEAAVQDHRAGRVQQAALAYQTLLSRYPRDPDVMQRLGVALAQLGRPADGAQLMAASLALNPNQPQVLLNLARAYLDSGEGGKALQCCDRAIALKATTADTFRLRARAFKSLGRQEDALANYGQAVRLSPGDPGCLLDLGIELESAGRIEDALTCFERAAQLDPGLIAAHQLAASMHMRRNDHQRVLQSLDRVLALQPNAAAIHSNRGNALKELARLDEAAEAYTRSLSIEPANPETLHNRAIVNSLRGQHADAWRDYRELLSRGREQPGDLVGAGAALLALDRPAEASPLLERATQQLPDSADAHVQYGNALLRLDRYTQAIASFDRALELNPNWPEVINNRGVAAAAAGRDQEAIEDFVRAGAVAADKEEVQTNIAIMLKQAGRFREAERSLERALALRPDDPAARFELALLHLTLGDFDQGWPLYEARFTVPALKVAARDFSALRWHGRESLRGKSIIIHAEQGLGDTIQFARYLPLLIDRGAEVVFEVMPQLKALMSSLPYRMRVIGRGEPIPPVDYHCPLLSLPLAFNTRLATIPASVPYLTADPDRVHRWDSLLPPRRSIRVGIAWQGNVEVERQIWARGRSMPLRMLAPLTRLEGIRLISLQKGPGAEQLHETGLHDRIADLGDSLDRGPDAFLDTVAVMENLDLVISTDTAIAHLAGALGRPTWVALSAAADWRWLRERTDSPWYPCMRLFRQSAGSDGWNRVVADMTGALSELAAGRS